MKNASDTLLHAIYEYRTLLMRAFVYGEAMSVTARVKLSGLDRYLCVASSPPDPRDREFKRTPVSIPACIVADGARIGADAVNLGAGGVCLHGLRRLPARGRVTVRLEGPRDYRFPAHTVWTSRVDDRLWAVGLAFVGVPVELRGRRSYDA